MCVKFAADKISGMGFGRGRVINLFVTYRGGRGLEIISGETEGVMKFVDLNEI